MRRFVLYSNLAVAVLVAVLMSMAGCPGPRPAPPGPASYEDVPTIRVLVATGESLEVASTGGFEIRADDRIVLTSLAPLSPARLTRQGKSWSVHLSTCRADRLTIRAIGVSCIRVGRTAYRGQIVFWPVGQRRILAVNHLPLESYLAGVLSRELLPNWHPEAYKAQAIAARTYALYEKATFGPGRPYDLQDDQSSQVYGGFSAETDRAWQAVRATWGLVLAAGPPGKEKIFRAHYSACCGGRTNSVYYLYGPPVQAGPLRGGVICDDCRSCPQFTWPAVRVDKDAIYRALSRVYAQVAELGAVKAVRPLGPDEDRPVWVDIVGPDDKKVRIRAQDLRLALLRDGASGAGGLYSANCRIRDAGKVVVFEHGRGFGHGVGLCQWGAQGKALRGLKARQILLRYYPGAKIFKAY